MTDPPSPSWAAETDKRELPAAAHPSQWRIAPDVGDQATVRCHALYHAYARLHQEGRTGSFVDPLCVSYARRGAFEEETVTVTQAAASHVAVQSGRWLRLLAPDAPVTVTHPDFTGPDGPYPLTLTADQLTLPAAPDDAVPAAPAP